MNDKEENPYDVDLGGTLCPHQCKIHNQPCAVVMEYTDEKIQSAVEALRKIQDAPPHDKKAEHYCDLCSRAMREGRELDFYQLWEDGVVRSKYARRAP